ncbi:BhlA/UviB family holin-like peptide [Clostridium sp. MB40-C1]|uniref:BhlA/UviB family holin-like peptide n=1 Tax=Clostridium sp. MB40-C1 TaxID=3070996 RepID=UPI0027E1868E|nr:BhlA/UviB family holin-like peptide [Clostridium sp. MB40-C1]WMJ81004.1 BhlA/UviB family holin-like peptide [Clostridium sp. MB40-C1]
MQNEIIKLALNQGIWSVLFVVLLFYILKTQEKRDSLQEKRERKYQEIITELTNKFTAIERGIDDIKEEIKDIRTI